MAEWFKAAVLKTASPKGDVGSNPTPSARLRQGFVWQAMNHVSNLLTSSEFGERNIFQRVNQQLPRTKNSKLMFETERCPRGRRGSPAKRVSPLKGDRGFESLSLRHVHWNVNNWDKG
jgi:hypothetical protein